MDRIRIGQFVQLTGVTLKTVKYYHQIGLLPEPPRSVGGYRLYGPAELNRMRLIRHLKSLGLDLQQIKVIVGDSQNSVSSLEVLRSLRQELLNEIKTLTERVTKIDAMINSHVSLGDGNNFDSHSFQRVTEILGPEQLRRLAAANPEIYEQHRRVHGILDDFQWGPDYGQTLGALAVFFKQHPEEFQVSLQFAARLHQISDLDEDDAQIEAFARESAQLIQSQPRLQEILFQQNPIPSSLEGVYDQLVTGVLSPARVRYNKLLQKYLGLAAKNCK